MSQWPESKLFEQFTVREEPEQSSNRLARRMIAHSPLGGANDPSHETYSRPDQPDFRSRRESSHVHPVLNQLQADFEVVRDVALIVSSPA